MKNRYVALILLFSFLLEGSLLVPWLIPAQWQNKLLLAPHFTLIILLLFSMLRSRHLGLVFGLAIGLMQDIVYASPMLGPHAFSMAFAAYAAGIAANRIKMNITLTFFVVSFCLLVYDFTIFSIYYLFRITPMAYGDLVTQLLTPSLLFNLLFAVLIYVPARKWLEVKMESRDVESIT